VNRAWQPGLGLGGARLPYRIIVFRYEYFKIFSRVTTFSVDAYLNSAWNESVTIRGYDLYQCRAIIEKLVIQM